MTILSLKMWSPFSLWTLLQQHFIGIVRALFFIDSYYPFQVFWLPVFVVIDFEELFLFILLPHNHTNHEGLEVGVLTATSPGQYHTHALPPQFWAQLEHRMGTQTDDILPNVFLLSSHTRTLSGNKILRSFFYPQNLKSFNRNVPSLSSGI